MIHAAGNDTSVNVAGSSFEDSTFTLICYNLNDFEISFLFFSVTLLQRKKIREE